MYILASPDDHDCVGKIFVVRNAHNST